MAKRRKKAEKSSTGLAAKDVALGEAPAAIHALRARVEADGGAVLAAYRDPLGAQWVVFASLPLEKVVPTPYQRELSDTHAKRLADVIPKVGRFLDPLIAVPAPEQGWWTPNGMHRLEAMKMLGARSVVALLLPEPEIAYRILALNTEKAHNLKDKSLEAIRMARGLAADGLAAKGKEADWAFEFEEPAFLTLGLCYEKNMRFAGSTYQPVLRRCDAFSAEPLKKSLERREGWAAKLIELDQAVNVCVKALKDAGLVSPYLKPFVVARINPLRWIKVKPGQKAPPADIDKTLEKMLGSALKFDAAKIKAQDISRAGGGAPAEEG
ncbi:MAG: ParB/RepB/Spo0J family partition protein [Planctomycetota bacterium]|nr:ParB/RepB/Spo0J family partition protein [Planctomycetota bacterium]